VICRSCGREIADKAIVCYRCGAPTDVPAPPPRPAPRPQPLWPGLIALVSTLGAVGLWVVPGVEPDTTAEYATLAALVLVALTTGGVALTRLRRGR